MKKQLLLFLIPLFLIFTSGKIFAQDFPANIFDTWRVNVVLNACNADITGDTLWNGNVLELELNNLSKDQNIDTVQLILKYGTGSADTCIFELNAQSDSTNRISADNSLCFDPVSWLSIHMLSKDSLHFHWLTPCNACSCGGIYQAQRMATSSLSESDFSDRWTVFPNPVSDRIFIKRNGIGSSEVSKIAFTNSLGVPLLTFDQPQSNFDFSTKQFASGVYYLVIWEGAALSVKKVLKF